MNPSPKPLVSVIMAAYNGEPFIAEAIESVLVQSYQQWELIVVDDGSTDRTAEIVNLYCNRDSRIKLFSQENRGAAAARNRAIAESKGDFFAILDCDDISLPERLKKQVEFLQKNPQVMLVGGWYRFLGQIKAIKAKPSNAALQYALTYCNPFFHSSVMIRRSVVGTGYREEFRAAHDHELLAKIATLGNLELIPEVLAVRRVVPSSITASLKHDQLYNAIAVVNETIRFWLPNGDDRLISALAHASLYNCDVTATAHELQLLHSQLLEAFLQRYPQEKRTIAAMVAQRMMLYRHFFFDSAFQRGVASLRFYRYWPKAFFYQFYKPLKLFQRAR